MIRKIWQMLAPAQRREAGVVFAVMVVVSFFEMLGVGVIMPLAMVLVDPKRIMAVPALRWLGSWLPVNSRGEVGLVVSLSILMLVVMVVKGLVVSYGYRRQFRFVFDLQKDLADRLLAGYMFVPYHYHLTRNSADLLKNLRGEIPAFAEGVLVPGLQVVSETAVGLALLGLLLLVNVELTIGAGLILGLAFGIIFRLTRRRNERLGAMRQTAMTQMFRHASNALAAVKDITVLGRQEALVAAHSDATQQYSVASAAHMVMIHVPRLLIEFLALSGLIGILLYCELVLHQPQAAVPLMAMYGMAAFRMVPSFNRVLAAAMSIRYHRRTVETLAAALVDVGEPELAGGASETLAFERDIRVRAVSYTYPGTTVKVLDAVDLRIEKGATIGFVGPSGAGKSTLADIVLGVLSGYQGEVVVDGVALGPTTLAAWRRRIGYVPQQIYLSDDTIAANVAFGIAARNVDRQAVIHALSTAQLLPFVASLPEDIDTEIGERGVRLSGGQRQRLGIARALYHNPDVLVLDEATASLDGPTEAEITQAMGDLAGSKTLIIIAHRLTTIERCDRIYLIEQGRIIDSGLFAELALRQPFFRQHRPPRAVSLHAR
ncbi:MAG: ABC transporter ATP-binding protein [Acidiferrobacter sp.]